MGAATSAGALGKRDKTMPTMLDIAIQTAVAAHVGQRDKAWHPYILHPLAVMLSMDPLDLDGQIVAVLHDVIEDTGYKLEYLQAAGFNAEIVAALDAITHRGFESNRDYWARVKANPLALRVKLQDIRHNSSEERLACLSPDTAARLRAKYAEALEFLTEDAK